MLGPVGLAVWTAVVFLIGFVVGEIDQGRR